jgi:hypothetical protein
MIYVAGNSCLTIDGSSDRIHICGDANRNAYLKVQDEARLVVSNINVAFPWQSKANMCGVLEIADSGIVSNVSFMGIGRGSTSSGLVKMNGGTLMLNSKLAELNSIQIGSNGSFTDGRITGWGRIAFDDPKAIMVDYASVLQRTAWGSMTLCGQIVADGGILDFSRGPTPQYTGSAYNTSGTNGYYAVNKGVLKFPRSLPRLKNTHKMVVESVLNCIKELGYVIKGLTFSSIKGPAGNIEYLVWFATDGEKIKTDIEEIVLSAHAALA